MWLQKIDLKVKMIQPSLISDFVVSIYDNKNYARHTEIRNQAM